MKTFLVPVDFSAVTEREIEAAVAQARAFQGRVALLPAEIVEEAVSTNRRTALQKLDGRLETFRAARIECSASAVVGVPDRAILDDADRVGADCIIMGSHGHGRLYDFLVGSTASGVIKRAKCAVLVIPPADKQG
jgi:nucleotide-binding universal stress UspA family protein